MVIQSPIPFQSEEYTRDTLRIPRPIDIFQLQTTVGTVFTARSDADFQIENLIAANVTGTNDTVTVYLVPDGGTAGASNTILYQRVVLANDILVIFDFQHIGLLQPGMTLQALCGTNDAINIYGYGYDYQGVYS